MRWVHWDSYSNCPYKPLTCVGVAVCRNVLWCVVVWRSVMRCGTVWCSVMQCGAVWCSVVQCGAAWSNVLHWVAEWCSLLQRDAVCCSVSLGLRVGSWRVTWGERGAVDRTVTAQNTATHCNTLQHTCSKQLPMWGPLRIYVLRCVEVCCSVLQCIAVCSSNQLPQWKHWNPCVAVCCSVLQIVVVYCTNQLPEWGPRNAYGISFKSGHTRMDLQCVTRMGVAVCCSVLQCVAMCCSVVQCVAVGTCERLVFHSACFDFFLYLLLPWRNFINLRPLAGMCVYQDRWRESACCSVLQRVAVCCSVCRICHGIYERICV